VAEVTDIIGLAYGEALACRANDERLHAAVGSEAPTRVLGLPVV
jgi:hypothetical protein